MRYLFASFGRIHEGNELMEWCTGKRKLKEPKTKIRRRADTWYTYINLGINDVYEAPKHNDEIKYIPRIPKVILPKEKHPIKRNMGLLTYWNSNKRWRRRWRWLWLCGTGRAGWAGRAVPQTNEMIRRERDIPAWSLCTARMNNKTKKTVEIKSGKSCLGKESFRGLKSKV